MPIVGQFGSLAGLGPLMLPGGAMESIATVTVGSGGASSITFSDIPGTYQHLQVRMISRTSASSNVRLRARLNSDSGSNYAAHLLYGNGSSALAAAGSSLTQALGSSTSNSTATATVFGGHVLDILDYASTSKATTLRMFSGSDYNGSGEVVLHSGLWTSTNAVTAISLFWDSGDHVQHSTAALYGIKAP